MKIFTFKQIKEFCKAHYEEYLNEPGVTILIDFNVQGNVKETGFTDLVEYEGTEVSTWQYVGYEMLGDNSHIFKFKRTA